MKGKMDCLLKQKNNIQITKIYENLHIRIFLNWTFITLPCKTMNLSNL